MARKKILDPDSPLPPEPDPFEVPEPPEPPEPAEPPAAAVAPSEPPAASAAALAVTVQRAPLSLGAIVDLGGASGSYEILRPLAAGGMAEVFLARRNGAAGFQRTVAIKRIHAQLAGREKYERMFLEEARLASRLHHRNIAQVYDLQKQGETFLLVMEFIDGTTVRAALEAAHKKGRTFSPAFACYVAGEVADALHHAHTAAADDGKPLGIVHRDCNPKNIMLSADGAVKLLDFGVAYSLLVDRERTDTGLIKGTWHYLSPEQAIGNEVLDGRSDVFALALVFAELMIGRRVFDAAHDTEVLLKISTVDAGSVDLAVAALPAPLQPVLRRALAKNRNDRYPTAAEFGRELRGYLRATGLAYGPSDAAAELAAVLAAPEVDPAARGPSRGQPLPAAPAAAPAPASAPSAPPPATPAPPATAATAATSGTPAAPAGAAGPSATEEKRLDELRARIRNPQSPKRRLVIPALVILGVIAIGNLAFFVLFRAGREPVRSSAPPELVKTDAQLRAEREAEQLKLMPPPAPPELAPAALAPPPPPLQAGVAPAAMPAAAAAPAPSPVLGLAPAAPPARRAVRRSAPASVAVAQPAGAPAPAEAPPLRRRSLDTSTATTFADAPSQPKQGAAAASVPRGTLLPARLLVPADTNPGPVSAEITRDVTVQGAVAVPRGSLLVCASQGASSGRIGLSCDGLTIGEQTVRMSGTALGADKRPGLPTGMVGGAGAGEYARTGSIDTAASIAGRLVGDGIAGDVARGATRIGAGTARDVTAPGTTSTLPAAAGTSFYVFVNSFGGGY